MEERESERDEAIEREREREREREERERSSSIIVQSVESFRDVTPGRRPETIPHTHTHTHMDI